MSKSSERRYKNLADKLLSVIGDKSQSELARELYTSQPAVCNWLSGKSRPEPWRLGLLAAILRLGTEQLEHLIALAGYDGNPDARDKALNAYSMRQVTK